MHFPDSGPLVDANWLKAHHRDPSLKILDATFLLPGVHPTGYPSQIIGGAIRFDVDAIKDPTSPLPHMLPPADLFEHETGKRGISSNDRIVCYDNEGIAGAARGWWMFRVFSHDNVRVLNGGIDAWRAAGGAMASSHSIYPPTEFKARFRPHLVKSAADMLANIDSRHAIVLDARAPGRFAGTTPEPRPGLRGGHIPGARNLPAASLTDQTGRYILPTDELSARFAAMGVDEEPLIASCGSGMTACTIALGTAAALGRTDVAVYDGSWTEWGARDDLPIETGA